MTTFKNLYLELHFTFKPLFFISKKNIPILKEYTTYRIEQKQNQSTPYYKILWDSRDIYNYIS